MLVEQLSDGALLHVAADLPETLSGRLIADVIHQT